MLAQPEALQAPFRHRATAIAPPPPTRNGAAETQSSRQPRHPQSERLLVALETHPIGQLLRRLSPGLDPRPTARRALSSLGCGPPPGRRSLPRPLGPAAVGAGDLAADHRAVVAHPRPGPLEPRRLDDLDPGHQGAGQGAQLPGRGVRLRAPSDRPATLVARGGYPRQPLPASTGPAEGRLRLGRGGPLLQLDSGSGHRVGDASDSLSLASLSTGGERSPDRSTHPWAGLVA